MATGRIMHGPTDAEIDSQIAARIAARKAKNFTESDRIRELSRCARRHPRRQPIRYDMAEKIKMKKPDNFTPITLDEFKKHYKPPRNPYKEVTQKTGKLEPRRRMDHRACRHDGVLSGHFLLDGDLAGLDLLAPINLRFDPPMGFVLWLFISNLIQILLMPLIMLGQNIQGQHAERRAEYDLEVNVKAEHEIETILYHLEYQNSILVAMLEKQGINLDEVLHKKKD